MATERAYVAISGLSRSIGSMATAQRPADRQGHTLTCRAAHKPAANAPRKFLYVGGRDQAVHGRRADDLPQVRTRKATLAAPLRRHRRLRAQPGIEYRIRIIEGKDRQSAGRRVFDPLDARPGDRAARGQSADKAWPAPLPRRRGAVINSSTPGRAHASRRRSPGPARRRRPAG